MLWSHRRIYADAAAATPLSRNVQKELARLLNVYGNPGALHKEAVEAHAELAHAREVAATSIGAHQDEIIFTSGGTESNNLALIGLLRRQLTVHGPIHAITSAIEHPSVLEPLRALKAEGLHLTELPVDSTGRISLEELRNAVTDKTVLVSIQFVNGEIGTIEPIRDISKEVRRIRKVRVEQGNTLPCYVHTDASQAPLWKTIRVDALGIDLLTLDGQKILGPKGVGALYVRRGVVLEPLLLGGGQERGLRSGTENVLLASAFAVALCDAQQSEDVVSKRITIVRNFLLQEILKRIPEVVLNGAVGDVRVCNNLNLSIPLLDGEMATIALDALGVAVSTRSACDASNEEPSHVLVALGTLPEVMKHSIRITLLPAATKKEATAIAVALKQVAQRYRIVV